MSTPVERLELVHDAFSKAYQRRAQDLKEAGSTEEAERILDNLDLLERAYLRAARGALDANAGEVEQAFEAASVAREEVEEAYRRAKALPDRIRLVTSLALNIKDLVVKAAGG
jgi:hypothetical protein